MITSTDVRNTNLAVKDCWVVCVAQWRGNTELLIEAGDQRRSISLPPGMHGKVTKAKFENKSLFVTIARS